MEHTNTLLMVPKAMPHLVSLRQVIALTGLSRATIYRLIDESSASYDPTFPKRIRISRMRIAWVSSEISAWIELKMAQRSA